LQALHEEASAAKDAFREHCVQHGCSPPVE
jgi:hypothetical protein